jgi:Flp pilus assembly protein CpaB
MSRTTSFLRDLIRAAGWHRRPLAALAAAVAVYCAATALAPEPPPTVAVLAAAHDLPGGTVLSSADLRTLRLPSAAVPDGALRAGAGPPARVLAGPVRAGEPLTDARFVSPGLVRRTGAGLVAYAIRIDDADAAALVRPGDRVDVLSATATAARAADTVASGITVIALPGRADGSGGAAGAGRAGAGIVAGGNGRGALVVVAVPSRVAAELAQASVNGRLSLAITAGPG